MSTVATPPASSNSISNARPSFAEDRVRDGSTPPFEVRRFDAPVGAEIIGLDLSKPVDQAAFAKVHRAHLDHHVVVFRDQRITPDQQIAFSRRFGPLQIHVLHQFQLPGHPEILVVSNVIENGKPVDLGDAGQKVFAGLAMVIVIGLLVEGLGFNTLERLTVRRWGVQK